MAHRRSRGQALVEFTIVFPDLRLLLLGMMEFGFAFSDRLTLGNASREGARVGSSLVTGQTTACTGDPNGVDTQIVASMQNILKSGGSDVDLAHIQNDQDLQGDIDRRHVGRLRQHLDLHAGQRP